jgi:hypothetical protein
VLGLPDGLLEPVNQDEARGENDGKTNEERMTRGSEPIPRFDRPNTRR